MRILLNILLTLGLLTSLENGKPQKIQVKEKHCIGYTKIEYGKAVDCKGDTIEIFEYHKAWKK